MCFRSTSGARKPGVPARAACCTMRPVHTVHTDNLSAHGHECDTAVLCECFVSLHTPSPDVLVANCFCFDCVGFASPAVRSFCCVLFSNKLLRGDLNLFCCARVDRCVFSLLVLGLLGTSLPPVLERRFFESTASFSSDCCSAGLKFCISFSEFSQAVRPP